MNLSLREKTATLPRRPSLPDADEMRVIAARDGIDAATALLYRCVLESPLHGPFVRRIEELCKRQRPPVWDLDADLVIVPGGFYRENTTSGADGRVVREEAAKIGCPTDFIPLESTGTLRQNAAILLGWLRARGGRPVILVSLSKGGADIKMALAQPGADAAFRHVAGWVNLCGIIDGTPMSEWLRSRSAFAALIRAYYHLRGQNLEFMDDLRCGPGSPLDFELCLPAHVHMINVVGFPQREHLTNFVSRRCHKLMTPLGPNDCGLVLADFCDQPGLIYPLWGADHYLKPKGDVRRLIAALLQYMAEELR